MVVPVLTGCVDTFNLLPDMSVSLRTAGLVLALVALAICSCSAPVAGQAGSDKVTQIPGATFTPTFNTYSGYINIPNSPKMFHYFVSESQGNPATDPVVLFLNGGPGCSSMMGALTGS